MALFTVTAQKESKDAKAGITFTNTTENGKQLIVVKSISETSIFADTALQPDFVIVKVNDVPVDGLSVQEAIDLIKMAEGTVTILARERYGDKVTATVTKTSNDMKTGIILGRDDSSGFATYIKEFIDTSPFKGKLPQGPSHQVMAINGQDVKGQVPQDVVTVIGSIPKGPLTIEMTKLDTKVAPKTGFHGATAPPNAPAGGQWGRVNYVGSQTGMAACLGCLCFGIPGLLVLCCPCDEKDVYRVNGKLYEADGTICPEPANKFTPSGPQAQRMAR